MVCNMMKQAPFGKKSRHSQTHLHVEILALLENLSYNMYGHDNIFCLNMQSIKHKFDNIAGFKS